MGHEYSKDGCTYYEFHVDSHQHFQDKCNTETEFGGYLSVRKPPNSKPIIMIGQDECTYKQYLMTKKQWFLPGGISELNPKTNGDGIMYSAFVSREFGFGHPLSQAQLERINEYRRGTKYLDEDAAQNVSRFHNAYKTPLTTSHFIHTFEYGLNQSGYWNFDKMIV